jgi:hypothetical protein
MLWVTWVVAAAAAVLAVWLLLEVLVRLFVEWPLRTDFYGSIAPGRVQEQQARFGVQVASGLDWAHLGWVADPKRERYRIERRDRNAWEQIGEATVGSFLIRQSGTYRVSTLPRDRTASRCVGEVAVDVPSGVAPVCVPWIDGPWQLLFRPTRAGDYINDHAIYQDAHGDWRLIGITATGDGNYADEKRFAVGVSRDFPPAPGMEEAEPVADFGELAWAPHVIRDGDEYSLFWSPHRLHRMTSDDGIVWRAQRVVLDPPFHMFFRDATVFSVAPGQWLLYATGRGRYFSRVDLYQSFDLDGWQYIGSALRAGWGSERNGIVGSMESPLVTAYCGRYYLSLTYNNDSFFWNAALLPLKIWLDRESYNDTLVFHADNPYDFGVYRGRARSPSLLTRLRAHAAKLVHDPRGDRWYITTAGWPWVATLTRGEAAVAPLRWEPAGEPAAEQPIA